MKKASSSIGGPAAFILAAAFSLAVNLALPALDVGGGSVLGADEFADEPASSGGGDDFGDSGPAAPAAGGESGVKVGGHTYVQLKVNQNGTSRMAIHYVVLTIDASFADWMQMNGDVGLGGSGPAWFEVDFSLLKFLSLKVGKIIIPFGILEQGMHHLYAGVPGKIFPLVWTEYGALAYGSVQPFGLFGVNYFLYGLNSATSLKQKAMGSRLELLPVNGMKAGASAYYDDHNDNLKDYEYSWSCDFEYKKWILGVRGEYLNRIVSPGTTNHSVQAGWFVEASVNFLPSLKGFFRYGELDPDTHVVDSSDKHNTVAMLRWNLPVKADHEVFLDAEYRWVMEKVNEVDDDAFLLNLWIYF